MTVLATDSYSGLSVSLTFMFLFHQSSAVVAPANLAIDLLDNKWTVGSSEKTSSTQMTLVAPDSGSDASWSKLTTVSDSNNVVIGTYSDQTE